MCIMAEFAEFVGLVSDRSPTKKSSKNHADSKVSSYLACSCSAKALVAILWNEVMVAHL